MVFGWGSQLSTRTFLAHPSGLPFQLLLLLVCERTCQSLVENKISSALLWPGHMAQCADGLRSASRNSTLPAGVVTIQPVSSVCVSLHFSHTKEIAVKSFEWRSTKSSFSWESGHIHPRFPGVRNSLCHTALWSPLLMCPRAK